MIFLLNNSIDKITSLKMTHQLHFMTTKMTSFDKYYESLKSSKKLSELTDDILFHLNQLMYIYISSSVILRWIDSPTEELKVNVFKTFFEQESVKEIASYCNHFSSTRYEALGERIHSLLYRDFEEYTKEIADSFANIRIPLKGTKDTWHKYLYIKYNLCFYVFTCIWQFLQVFPDFNEFHIVGVLDPEGDNIQIPDFFDYPLYEIDGFSQNKKSPLSIKDVLRKAAPEALECYIKLAQTLYNPRSENIAQITNNYFIQNNMTNLFNNSFNHFEFSNKDTEFKESAPDNDKNSEQFVYTFTTEIRKFMFEELTQNEYFKNINIIVPSFYDYCYLLIDCNYLEYKDNYLQSVSFQNKESIDKKFPDYYFYRFLNDESFDLYFQKNTIRNDYKKLINVPIQNNRGTDTYSDEFQTFFLKKYNELIENKKAYAERM